MPKLERLSSIEESFVGLPEILDPALFPMKVLSKYLNTVKQSDSVSPYLIELFVSIFEPLIDEWEESSTATAGEKKEILYKHLRDQISGAGKPLTSRVQNTRGRNKRRFDLELYIQDLVYFRLCELGENNCMTEEVRIEIIAKELFPDADGKPEKEPRVKKWLQKGKKRFEEKKINAKDNFQYKLFKSEKY